MAATCPYCRTDILIGDNSAMECTDCNTPHHLECYEENGGCTLFGCKNAPPDEPKLQVTATDVHVAVATSGPAPTVRSVANTFGDAQGTTLVVESTRSAPPPPPPLPGNGATQVPLGNGLQMNVGTVTESDRTGYVVPGGILAAADATEHKSKTTYVILGIFLGFLGIHNFYLGYTKRALVQLALTIFTVGYAAAVTWIWAIVEVMTMDRDANNVTLA